MAHSSAHGSTEVNLHNAVKAGAVKVFDTNLIYSRVIYLQDSERDIDIKHVLGHELAPVPASMFDDTGDMRFAKTKFFFEEHSPS